MSQTVRTGTAAALVNPYRIVKFDGAGGIVQATAGGDLAIGVADSLGAASGARIDIYLDDIAWVEAGAAVAAGALVTSDAQGRAVTAVAGNRAIGVAWGAAQAAGDLIEVLLVQGGVFPALTGLLLTANALSELAGTAATARANLGLGSLALQNVPTPGAVAGSGAAAAETAAPVRRTVITLTNRAVATTDAAGTAGYGGSKLYDFPEGLIQVLGASCDLTLSAAAGIAATAAVVGSLGTATAGSDNATLTGTEADIIPSTACSLTGSAGAFKGKATATTMAAGMFDGTSAAKAAYLNFAIPDADSSANSTITINGTVTLTWVLHGDN